MKLLMVFMMMLFTLVAKAYVVPVYRDLKPATQAMLERQDFGLPAASSAGYVKAAGFTGPTSAAAATVSTFDKQPDVPRNLILTPSASVAGGTVVVNGTNYFGRTISENFVFTGGQTAATTGAKAFKTVTSIVFPASIENAPYTTTWQFGVSGAIGLKNCMANAGDWSWSEVAGAYETTRATMANSASAVESNTATFNGTMNGTNRFLGFFVQNFACLP